jgi:hypothetical protein
MAQDMFGDPRPNIEHLAFCASLIASTAPLIEVSGMIRQRRASFASAVYYALMWLNYAGWAGYGRLMPDEESHWAVRVSNTWGCMSCLYYCYQIQQYLPSTSKRKVRVLSLRSPDRPSPSR